MTAGPSTEDATPASATLTLVTDVPNGLGLVSQPTSATAGQPILPPILINIVDNNNNTVTTDNTQLVTLSIASGPAGATLSGETTVGAVDGIAAFTGLSVSLAGTYVLVATGGILTPIPTNPIEVSPVAVKSGDLPPISTSPIEVAPVVVKSGLTIRREPLHQVKQVGRRKARTEVVREKVTIKNTSRHALSGPVALEINGLAADDTLSNASGTDDGVPYLDILIGSDSLAAHRSLTATLDFTIEGKAPRNLQSIYKNIEAMLGL